MGVVSGIDPEEVLEPLVGQIGLGRGGGDAGQIGISVNLQGRLGDVAHGRSDHAVDQVVGHELVRDIDALGRVHGIVAHDLFDLDSFDAALVVPLIDGDLGGVEDFHARRRRVSGEGTGIADLDSLGYVCAESRR